MNYLAFDLGASGGKVFLGRFGGDRISLEETHRFPNSPVAVNDGLYWNLLGIYSEMNTGIGKALEDAGGQVESIGIDSYSNDFAFIDRNGELLTPLRSYRDGRTERYKDVIYSRLSAEQLYRISGNQIAPFNTLMQLAAMREAGQGFILDNADKLLFTPDLLINFLTGETVAEYTISSVSQMWDFRIQDWSREILSAFDIPRGLFGKVVYPGTVAGRTKDSFNRCYSTKGFNIVSVCEHDTGSAYLAAGARRGEVIISSGTWSLVGTEVEEPVINETGYRYNIANEGGYPGRHRLIRNVMGLWIIQQLRNDYISDKKEYTFPEMEEAAEAAEPFAFRIDPDDPVFFAPGDMREKIRMKCLETDGKAPAGMGAFTRCVEESLAFKYRWAVERLEQLTGESLTDINIVGGGSMSTLLCQFTADASGRAVRAGVPDATALGNILVQMIASGSLASMEEGRQLIADSFPVTEYVPRDSSRWNEKYQEYKQVFSLD